MMLAYTNCLLVHFLNGVYVTKTHVKKWSQAQAYRLVPRSTSEYVFNRPFRGIRKT